jgi:hypothetical protein
MALEVVFLHILEVLEPFEKSPARHGFARATPFRAPTVSQRDDQLIGACESPSGIDSGAAVLRRIRLMDFEARIGAGQPRRRNIRS